MKFEKPRKYDLSRPQYRIALELLEGINLKNKKVVDIGAGLGEFADILTKKGAKVLCIEGDDDCYDYVSKYHQTIQLDLDNCRLHSQIFTADLYVMLDVIEHLRNPENLLNNLHHIMPKHSKLVITSLNYNFYIYRIKSLIGKAEYFISDRRHLTLFTANSLQKFLEEQGFKILKSCGETVIPKLRYRKIIRKRLNLLSEQFGFLCGK